MLLIYLDKNYIRPPQSNETGIIGLMKVPDWASDELKEKIVLEAGGPMVKLDENTANTVAESLRSVSWIHNITVQTTTDSVQVYASYRKPVAVIQSGQIKFYIDSEQVVLDYVPMPDLKIVEIKGIMLENDELRLGQRWERDDLAAGIKILGEIYQMSMTETPKNPLIDEIASIDLSNYQGRRNKSKPHIVLYSTDNTEIQWGAEFGAGTLYFESPDYQKLAKLFSYYDQEGTLNGGSKIKFINLRDPQDKIPLPIDNY